MIQYDIDFADGTRMVVPDRPRIVQGVLIYKEPTTGAEVINSPGFWRSIVAISDDEDAPEHGII